MCSTPTPRLAARDDDALRSLYCFKSCSSGGSLQASTTGSSLVSAGAPPAAANFLDYDCHFSNGLTVVIGGTGTMSYTVEWF